MTGPWQFTTRRSLAADVLACVDPDDDEWRRMVDRLAELVVNVDVVCGLLVSYRVDFGPVLDVELRRRGR